MCGYDVIRRRERWSCLRAWYIIMMCIYKSRGFRRVVFVFRRHPVDYSRVVVIIVIIFSLFILDYAHFTPGPPAVKDTAPANRFIFCGKIRELSPPRDARSSSGFFSMPLLSLTASISVFFSGLCFFVLMDAVDQRPPRGRNSTGDEKKCIYNVIKNIRLRTPTADDHKI